MRWQLPLVATLALFVAVGCDEQPVEPGSDIVAEDQAFNFTNNPDAGPLIIRGDDMIWGTGWVDWKRGLIAVFGIDARDFCLGSRDWALLDFQRVIQSGNRSRILEVLHGQDLPAAVWPFAEWNCARFLTEPPLVEGFVDMVATDNDFEGEGHNNAYAFGWRVHGAFSGHSKCVLRDNDWSTASCTEVIIVR